MRTTASLLLLLAYLALILKPSMPLLEYELRQGTIAKVFCINQNEPEMNCQGACYLNKRLKEAAGESPTPSENEQEIFIPAHVITVSAMQMTVPDLQTFQGGNFFPLKQTQESPPVPPPEYVI